jgi:glycosyltransferase involved in cell wall biosynthesis
MGCPEWEDADFLGDVGDHYYPNWERVDLRGFRRPEWFAQGRVKWCISYLLARRDGSPRKARFWWRMLRLDRAARASRLVRFVERVWYWGLRRLRKEYCALMNLPDPYGRLTVTTRHLLFLPVVALANVVVLLGGLLSLPVYLWRRARSGGRASRTEGFSFGERTDEMIGEFRARFPERSDQLKTKDMAQYSDLLPRWRQLFARYDFVEAYATDTILPMLAGAPYVAYEHGTLRDIPFEQDRTGRLTSLSYSMARHTFITNPDCIEATERLGIESRSFVPHLIDRKYHDPKLRESGELPPGVREPFVFCPSRHDWEIKGTDILLRAFALVAREQAGLQLVMASWGVDLERSRELAGELGITDRVRFIPAMHVHDLIRVAARASAIVDQFRYGVFGGIAPTALAVGTPLVTHLDHAKSSWCVREPPYHEARDVDSCRHAVSAAISGEIPAAVAQSWVRRNYWYEDVVERHAEVYMRVLERRGDEVTERRREEETGAMQEVVHQ